jgi:RecA/RadA recombinase
MAAKKVRQVTRPVKPDIQFEIPFEAEHRTPSGLYSLDQSIGGGFPDNTITEIYGWEYVGKSTVADYLSGKLAVPYSRIGFLAFEPFGQSYVESNLRMAGFSGKVWVVPTLSPKGDPMTHEERIDLLIDTARDDATLTVGVVDTLSAIVSTQESEGSVADANMGKRAQLIHRLMRKTLALQMTQRVKMAAPFALLACNHLGQIMGMQASTTTGGTAPKKYAATRLRLAINKRYDDGSLWVQGAVEKVRFRGEAGNRDAFHVFLKAGQGVHPGLTAVIDCIQMGYAENEQGRISMGAKKFGLLSKMIEKEDYDFTPFVSRLQQN